MNNFKKTFHIKSTGVCSDCPENIKNPCIISCAKFPNALLLLSFLTKTNVQQKTGKHLSFQELLSSGLQSLHAMSLHAAHRLNGWNLVIQTQQLHNLMGYFSFLLIKKFRPATRESQTWQKGSGAIHKNILCSCKLTNRLLLRKC